GKLLLDPPGGLLALLEPLPLRLGELALGLRLGSLRPGGLELGGERLFPLLDLARLRSDLRLAPRELLLARVECLRTLECCALAGRERLGGSTVGFGLLRRLQLRHLSAAERPLPLVELALARAHRFRTFAEELLQPLDLGTRLRMIGVALRRELTRESKQRLLLDVDARLLGASRRARRPRVEAVLPAVYDDSFRQQMLTMYGSPAIRVWQVSQSMSMTPSSRLTWDEPRWREPC